VSIVRGVASNFSSKYNAKMQGNIYAVRVDDVWYGFSKNKINANKGDLVEFEATQNGNFWNGDIKSFKVVASQDKGSPAKATTGGKASFSPGAEDSRQRSIIIQHSQEMAINWVAFLVAQSAVKVGTAKAASQAALDKLLDEYTSKFAVQAGTGPLAAAPAKPSSEPSAEVAAEEADSDEIPW
jgi:hypothetical protein